MTEENTLPVVDKQGIITGIPFQVVDKNPRELWLTNYGYWLSQKAKGASEKPLIGRFTDKELQKSYKSFQVYNSELGEWENKNFWDYSQAVVDKSGNNVLNAAGKPRRTAHFSQKFEYHIKTETPVDVTYWDKELRQKVTTPLDEFKIRFSGNLSDKLQDQLTDERNPDDAKYVLLHDATQIPANQYKIKFTKGN